MILYEASHKALYFNLQTGCWMEMLSLLLEKPNYTVANRTQKYSKSFQNI